MTVSFPRWMIIAIAVLTTVILAAILFVEPTFAQESKIFNAWGTGSNLETQSGLSSSEPTTVVLNVVYWVVTLLGVLFFMLMLYAGMRWMTAGGNPEHVTKAKETLRSSILGLLITMGSAAIGNFVIIRTASLSGNSSLTLIDGESVGLGGNDLETTVVGLLEFALGVLAVVAVVFVLYAGFTWMTSRGQTAVIEKSQQTLTRAVIGLVIVMAAWGMTRYIVGVLGVASNGDEATDAALWEAYEEFLDTPQGRAWEANPDDNMDIWCGYVDAYTDLDSADAGCEE